MVLSPLCSVLGSCKALPIHAALDAQQSEQECTIQKGSSAAFPLIFPCILLGSSRGKNHHVWSLLSIRELLLYRCCNVDVRPCDITGFAKWCHLSTGNQAKIKQTSLFIDQWLCVKGNVFCSLTCNVICKCICLIYVHGCPLRVFLVY